MKSKGLLIVLIGISLGFWVHWSLGVILFLVGVYVGVKEDEKQRAAEEAGQAEKDAEQAEETAERAEETAAQAVEAETHPENEAEETNEEDPKEIRGRR